MRINAIKTHSIIYVFIIVLLTSSILWPVSLSAEARQRQLIRRWNFAAAQCIEKHTSNHSTSFSNSKANNISNAVTEIIGDYGRHGGQPWEDRYKKDLYLVFIGRDIGDREGTTTCKKAITQAILSLSGASYSVNSTGLTAGVFGRVLEETGIASIQDGRATIQFNVESEGEAQNLFFQLMTGSRFISSAEYTMPPENSFRAARLLFSSISAAVGEATASEARARSIELINICFDAASGDDLPEVGSRDIAVPGIGNFYFKSPKQEDLGININNLWEHAQEWAESGPLSGQNRPHVGDHELGFNAPNEVGPGGYSSWDSSWFVLGSDLPGAEDLRAGAIASCRFVHTNQDWLFSDDISISGDQAVFTGDEALGGDGDDTIETSPSCEGNNPLNLNWWLCGMLDFMDRTIQTLAREVDRMLEINEATYDRSQNPQLYNAWALFRSIASLLLVLIGLVMIMGQAINKE